MLTFAIAIFFLLITPGPGVLSTAGVGAAYGYKPGTLYVAGLCIGTNLVALMVVTGLAALIFSIPFVRPVLLVASVAYLTYLAAKIALSGSKIAFIQANEPPGITGGITLQFINPKAYVFNTTLFSGFSFMENSLMAETIIKFLIINAVWIPVHFAWLWAGVTLHRLNLDTKTQRAINVAMAASMLIVVGLAVFVR